MHKSNVLIPDNLDLINRSEPTQIIPQRRLGRLVVQPSEVNVPRRLVLSDGLNDRGGDVGRFSPSDLEFLTVKSELLDRGVGVEGGCCGTVEEGDEDAGLLGKESNGFDGSETDEVEEFVDRGVWRRRRGIRIRGGNGTKGKEEKRTYRQGGFRRRRFVQSGCWRRRLQERKNES